MTLRERRRPGEFILSEADGFRSRTAMTIASGLMLEAGTVLQSGDDGAMAFDSGTCVGVLIGAVDTRLGSARAAVLSGEAEVIFEELVYPVTKPATTWAALKALGIIGRGVVGADTNGGGGGDLPLAVIDFEGGSYGVGATSYAVADMLSGGDFNAGDISNSNGWFPQTDQFPNFGAVLSSVLGTSDGLVVVVDAEAVDPFLGSFQISLLNAAPDVFISFQVDPIGTFTLSGNTTTVQNGDGLIGRAKFGFRVAPSEFSIDATGKIEQDAAPDPSEFSVWTVNSFIEAGNAASFKIYSIKFYAANADIAALVS